MKLKHKNPCAKCPWRLEAPAGWLGGITPEFYTDAVRNNEVPACHLKDFGPASDKTAMCAGALAVMANSALLPHNTEGGPAARRKVGKRDDCFSHYAFFYKYHSGKIYVHPLMRGK